MQTFLPIADYTKSAEVLDFRRLGKQRSETIILVDAILYGNKWSNHPAAKMWHKYVISLCDYGIEICREWIRRGYKDNCLLKLNILKVTALSQHLSMQMPNWLGNSRLHESHRASLLFKDYQYYSKYGWKETPEIKYIWPLEG